MRPFSVWCAIAWAVLVGALSLQHALAPQSTGPLALAQVFAPHAFLPLVAALAMWRWPGHTGSLLRISLVLSGLVFAVRFTPGWIGLPQPPEGGASTIGVTSWNLKLGEAQPIRILEGLRTAQPGILALQELTPRHARAIAADPELLERFPHRVLWPQADSSGVGLLSSYPVAVPAVSPSDVSMLITDIVLDDKRTVTVAVVHAEPPSFGADILGLPLGDYDPSLRDSQIGSIRAALEEQLGTGRPVLMLGDFNITDREIAYGSLSRGLTDAQRAVGVGPGATWRPTSIEWLPFGLLRIDMLLTGPAIQPLSIATDCSPRGSDHCILSGVVALSKPESGSGGP